MPITKGPPSPYDDTPSTDNSSPSKLAKCSCSLLPLISCFKAKLEQHENDDRNVASPSATANNNENDDRNVASPSATANNNENDDGNVASPSATANNNENDDRNVASPSATANNNDDHGGASGLCKMIDQDLIFMKKNIFHVNERVNQVRQKYEELKKGGSSETQLDEIKKLKTAATKLKLQSLSPHKIHSAVSEQRRLWPDINKYDDEMLHPYQMPKFEDSMEPKELEGILNRITYLKKCLLLVFLIFPPMTVIKRRFLVYWWIADGLVGWHRRENHIGEKADEETEKRIEEKSGEETEDLIEEKSDEEIGNSIFDVLVADGFIKPVCQNCSFKPDSAMMGSSFHSAFTEIAVSQLNVSAFKLGQANPLLIPHKCAYVINLDEAIVDGGPELFGDMKNIKIMYLGRWQSSAAHHIEVESMEILRELKNMRQLKFLSLQGISLITVLPSFISQNDGLEILDLRACPNLEVIPDWIGSLSSLTHLDMSDCYFLDHMPKSLAALSRLQVLKGFFVGESKDNRQACTLDDLSKLKRLKKLNIYTNMVGFPTERHLSALRKFEALRKLTISWGGCSPLDKNDSGKPPAAQAPAALPSQLQKLDLQCFRGMNAPSWLSPTNLKQLKKLFIRGGKLCELGHFDEEDQWYVEILRLKHLGELRMDWKDLKKLFPRLNYLHKEDCPNLTNVPIVEGNGWMHIQEG